MVMLHARSLEAFSRFVALQEDLLVPLVQASFECLQVIPIEQNGQLPPPAKVSQQWKEEAVARTAMAKVLLNCAKEAPAAFLPHLQPLVARVQQLWDQGVLRQGEKVSLYEGLMAAATSGGPELQGQLLEWLLRPVHAKWSRPEWRASLEGPAAFAREYMSFEVAPGGGVVVESRWGRRVA
ncbi:hypothetical protein MNEG_13533 [Monoraphidium neglectum]|uniref:Exportin-5 C-terminal domain-containing protein n=1 Tax=Monoraphidium neglectum TaxID=145388 RepID=A0A0D2KEX6_9CHLO|nr:hypothetical protein MNEG_13533 [Monoraphidium neglectum]KIY94428.1 hypothetical protein MNEG_13533 [Monoraphidium neglectum]|eukprot:XP_013893448.1 hypothetical protein MNEG_13533 [Monoraphidium neglectum]